MSHNFPVSMRLIAAIGVAMATAMSAATVTAASDQSLPTRYDLRYSVTDDRLQIFDDGVNTRMLLPEGTQIPLVRTFKSGAEQLVVLQREAGTQFILLPGLHHKLIMTWPGQRHVNVSYQGNAHQATRAGSNIAYGSAPLVAAHGAVPAPIPATPGNTQRGVAGEDAPRVSVLEKTQGDPTGLQGSTRTQQSPGAAPPRPQKWIVLIEDVSLENTLKRWAEQASYQLLWDTDREVQIPAKDEFFGTFEEALSRVLQSPAIRNSEHPLEAVIYANNPPLVRITRIGEQ